MSRGFVSICKETVVGLPQGIAAMRQGSGRASEDYLDVVMVREVQ